MSKLITPYNDTTVMKQLSAISDELCKQYIAEFTSPISNLSLAEQADIVNAGILAEILEKPRLHNADRILGGYNNLVKGKPDIDLDPTILGALLSYRMNPVECREFANDLRICCYSSEELERFKDYGILDLVKVAKICYLTSTKTLALINLLLCSLKETGAIVYNDKTMVYDVVLQSVRFVRSILKILPYEFRIYVLNDINLETLIF